ncbi:flagellar hook-length control protein FliK [Cupriavidus taiwanensis]|uniref:FliK: Flagellar Biosynthesis protein hook-length control protein n=1 Tax=Cupriavidus taiwanensis TaxID=164546 RepID=A0A975XFF1_9BURK|nr:FliK: Flagellar Biosynthesis protein; hook-length control protein [Cupriavidus taiwanensis]
MIDISQIVSSAANAVEGARRASADAAASGFRDALSQARDSHKAATPAPAAKETVARDKPAARPAAAQADGGKPQHAVSKKPAPSEKDQDQEDTASAPTDAAAAAAALALMLPAAAPANPAAVPTGAAGAAGTTGTAAAAVAGMADTGTAAALQAALAGAPGTSAQTQADADATAGLAAGTTLPGAMQAASAEARPAQPSVADTLATIASQRAALQPGGSTGTDAKTGTTQSVAGDALALRQPDLAGQDAGASAGGSGHRPDSGLGQHRADALAASTGTPDARSAATPFAAVQAARAGDTVSASPEGTPAMVATLAGQPTPAAAAAAASRPVVAPPLYDSQWPQALGQQMIRLGTQGQQSAELQLNPPDLGPLKVVLNVVNDQAQAQFVSPHQAVRAAVEAALPHLRTALSENGIQLGHTSVGADGFASQAGNGNGQQQQAPGHGRGQAGFGGAAVAAVEPVPAGGAAARPARVLAQGEIDTFA